MYSPGQVAQVDLFPVVEERHQREGADHAREVRDQFLVAAREVSQVRVRELELLWVLVRRVQLAKPFHDLHGAGVDRQAGPQ